MRRRRRGGPGEMELEDAGEADVGFSRPRESRLPPRRLLHGAAMARPDTGGEAEEVGTLVRPLRQPRPRRERALAPVARLAGRDEVPLRVVAAAHAGLHVV